MPLPLINFRKFITGDEKWVSEKKIIGRLTLINHWHRL